MILDQDVVTSRQVLIAPRGCEVTPSFLEHLRHFAKQLPSRRSPSSSAGRRSGRGSRPRRARRPRPDLMMSRRTRGPRRRGKASSTPVIVAALVLASLAGWTIAGASGLLADASRIAIYAVANLVLGFDSIDLILRMWFRRLHGAAAGYLARPRVAGDVPRRAPRESPALCASSPRSTTKRSTSIAS